MHVKIEINHPENISPPPQKSFKSPEQTQHHGNDPNCNCRSKLVSQLTNGQLNSKCDDTRRTLVCTGLLGKQGNQHHITGYGNESQQCLQSETVN